MKKYYFISAGSTSCRQMFADLECFDRSDFKYIKDPIKIKSTLLRKIFNFYFRLNSKIKMPLLRMWEHCYSIPECDPKDENYLVLTNGVFNYYTAEYLNRLKNKYNFHYIPFLIDPLAGFPSDFMKTNLFGTKYDMIYSFDRADAEKIGGNYSMQVYSKKAIEIEDNRDLKGQVYFAGTNKRGRLAVLEEIYSRFKENDINFKFRIINVCKSEQKHNDIIYNQPIEYNRILEEMQNYSCVLEVVQPGQMGVTLRYYEAISYNKKLITNNQFVKQLPFYNPEFMYVFNEPNDIDMAWIQKDINVDYGYNNEFSPIELMKEIIEKTSEEIAT